MVRPRIAAAAGDEAVAAALTGADRDTTALAVRYLLQLLAERFAGNTVEVRVPPYGAVQCIPGPRHTRGTPPNVVEMGADEWLRIATGRHAFADAVAEGAVHASGTRADLTGHVPIWRAAR